MNTPETFTSAIGPLISRYLGVKRALGRRAVALGYILRQMDRFLTSCSANDLTSDTFTAWADSMHSLHPSTRATRLRAVYHFCLFRRRENPQSFVPDPTQFPSSGHRPLPYIFSEGDILGMLTATEALASHAASPLHREVARVAIVILYTTGLRRGEVVRLTFNDYDRAAQVLHVRRTKFGKSRLVPLSADTTAELDRYLEAHRRAGAPREQDSPLLVNHHGECFRSYTGAGLGQLLRKITRAAGIKTARGRTPRVHDLRFTFAAQALLRWYRDGVDVQSRLPALATYLGHVSVVSTQYYLTFLNATAEAASERFHRHAAAWLPLNPTDGGRR